SGLCAPSPPRDMEYMNAVENWWKQVMMYGNRTKKMLHSSIGLPSITE
ncbi:ZDHHC17 isoform 8, partial [Pongo abelii]